ncbi:MAG: Gfo/Idh/MocA family oxidoreductase [Spirochaetales bacterium]|nr:Gfo/Idh/MocA family oxidoreductase [Spirochaetales bacterium]
MSKPKKPSIGIIGDGMIGDVHITGIKKDKRAEVTWISTRTQKTLDEKLAKHKVLHGTLDYKEMLADSSLDAVIICTPPYLHLPMTIDAVHAGKHVLIEKPIVSDPKDLKKIPELVEENKKSGKIIMEPSFRHGRQGPKYQFLKSFIDSGKLGKIYHIHHNHLIRRTYIEYNPRAAWSLDKKKSGGGPILDQGVYDLSFHLGLLDDKPQLKDIRFFTRNELKKFKKEYCNEVEEHGAAFMEFTTGLTYYYERGEGVQCEIENETRLFGTKGSLKFGFYTWQSNKIEHFYSDDQGKEKREILKVDMSGYDHDNLALSRHFVDCILGIAQPMTSMEIAIKNLEILFRIVS